MRLSRKIFPPMVNVLADNISARNDGYGGKADWEP